MLHFCSKNEGWSHHCFDSVVCLKQNNLGTITLSSPKLQSSRPSINQVPNWSDWRMLTQNMKRTQKTNRGRQRPEKARGFKRSSSKLIPLVASSYLKIGHALHHPWDYCPLKTVGQKIKMNVLAVKSKFINKPDEPATHEISPDTIPGRLWERFNAFKTFVSSNVSW